MKVLKISGPIIQVKMISFLMRMNIKRGLALNNN
jgi:hypothetical protein